MTDTMFVCHRCHGDHLGGCSDSAEAKGFNVHCFDCDLPAHKVEVPFPADGEKNALDIIAAMPARRISAFDAIRATGKLHGKAFGEPVQAWKVSPFNPAAWVDGKFVGRV